jgi:hypothetical protein
MYEFELEQDIRVVVSDKDQVKRLLQLFQKYPPRVYQWVSQLVHDHWWITIHAIDQTECCWNAQIEYCTQNCAQTPVSLINDYF